VTWFAERGVTVQRACPTFNGGAYRSSLWRHTFAELGITPNGPGPIGQDVRTCVTQRIRRLVDLALMLHRAG
jgi:hypothetical protein